MNLSSLLSLKSSLVSGNKITMSMWMWTCLLVLCTQYAVGRAQDKVEFIHCPTQCTCRLSYIARYLSVDCRGQTRVDLEQLSEELDLLLSRYQMKSLLSKLIIVNTPLTHVPRSVCQLATLTHLTLDHNRLTRLPENCFANLSNLEYLSTSDNVIQTLEGKVFEGLTKVWCLNLSSNRIESIGSSICQLTSLMILDLDHNQLTGLPDNCLTNLTNLVRFSANDNVIGTLQDGVFDGLEKLWYLDVGRNRIDSICQLTALTVLLVEHNLITRLPDNCFSNLTNLESLWASDNAIEILQNGVFEGLVKLQYLDLSKNSIASIDWSVCQLTALRHLYLHYNRLTSLPDSCFTNLKNLKSFSASYNAIETLQDGVFDGLTKLKSLYLGSNRISSIGLSVFATSSNFSSLFTIDLSWNNLTSLEPWVYDRCLIGNYSQKVSINLTSNKISKFTNKMGNRRMCQGEIPFGDLFLQNNNIRHLMDLFNGWQIDIRQATSCFRIKNGEMNMQIWIDTLTCDCIDYEYYNVFDVPSELLITFCNRTNPLTRESDMVDGYHTDLSKFVCEITERCPRNCTCVNRPSNSTLHVYCSNSNLTVLPLDLPELPDSHTKYKLDFSNNRFLRDLIHRNYFVNTSSLDCSNCGVVSISEEIVKIPDINLFGNKITSLPSSVLPVYNTTKTLNLANNPWDCSCNNRWMSKWLNYTKIRLTQQVLCDSPSRLHGKNIIEVSEKEFCVDPVSEAASKAASEAEERALIISFLAFAALLFVLLSVGFIVYHLRVTLYTRWKFHPFDRDECLGEDMDYDVFLSCSSLDDDPHGQRILKLIELNGYRVCYHERDFLPGELISDNICTGTVQSKRTICLLSENFLRSAYCMHEFQVAYHHNIIEKGKKRLIVVMMLDSPKDLLANDDPDTAVLRQFLRQYTYIDYTADDWLDRLLYALPLHGLLQSNDDFNDIVQLV